MGNHVTSTSHVTGESHVTAEEGGEVGGAAAFVKSMSKLWTLGHPNVRTLPLGTRKARIVNVGLLSLYCGWSRNVSTFNPNP